MISHTDFKDLSYQVSAFTLNFQMNINRILRAFLDKYSDRFNGEPVSIPIPEGAPKEIPRIILQSDDKIWKLQVSPIRIDFFWKGGTKEVEESTIGEFIRVAKDILSLYQEVTKTTYGRLALVFERIADIENPGLSLAKHFCKDIWTETVLNKPEYFEIHAHKRYKVDDKITDINSWIRHKVVTIKLENQDEKKVILVEQDLNTPSENIIEEDFTVDMRQHFLDVMPSEIATILKKYYPHRNLKTGK